MRSCSFILITPQLRDHLTLLQSVGQNELSDRPDHWGRHANRHQPWACLVLAVLPEQTTAWEKQAVMHICTGKFLTRARYLCKICPKCPHSMQRVPTSMLGGTPFLWSWGGGAAFHSSHKGFQLVSVFKFMPAASSFEYQTSTHLKF